MKKALTALIVGMSCIAYAQTYTQTQFQQSIANSIGIAIVGHNGTTFTNALTTSFAIVSPPGVDFSSTFAGSSDFTIATNGAVTCNFDGKVSARVSGSFEKLSGGTAETVTGHWFVDEVDQNAGMVRTLGNNSFGSFYGGGNGAITVSNGDVLTFRTKNTASENVAFEDFQLEVRRID